MSDRHFRTRNELSDLLSDFVDGLNSVMDEKNLAAPIQFELDGPLDEGLVEFRDVGFPPEARLIGGVVMRLISRIPESAM